MIAEALRFWDAISGKVKALVKSETQNVFRCERYEVTTAPDGSKIGVTLPLGTKEIFVPYSREVADAVVGNTVLVVWWGSMSNAKAYYYANGYSGMWPETVYSGYVDVPVSITSNANVSPFTAYGYSDASSYLPAGYSFTGANVIDNTSTNPCLATVKPSGSVYVYGRSAEDLTVRLTYHKT